MKRAILLTGFNNWGKTTHIYNLFNKGRFLFGYPYQIPGVNTSFTVESHSNDDFDELGFVAQIAKRMSKAPSGARDLFCAFCPTRDPHNDSRRILVTPPFSRFNEIHLLLLKHKWDFHAELRINEIKSYLGTVPNIHFHTIDADKHHSTDVARGAAREKQIRSILQGLYP